jgi:CheY-like chemotaxis protein
MTTMPAIPRLRIALAEDERPTLEHLSAVLGTLPHVEVLPSRSVGDLMRRLTEQPNKLVDVLVTDWMFEGHLETGKDAITHVRKHSPKCDVAVLTAFADQLGGWEVVEARVHVLLQKPVPADALTLSILDVLLQRLLTPGGPRSEEVRKRVGYPAGVPSVAGARMADWLRRVALPVIAGMLRADHARASLEPDPGSAARPHDVTWARAEACERITIECRAAEEWWLKIDLGWSSNLPETYRERVAAWREKGLVARLRTVLTTGLLVEHAEERLFFGMLSNEVRVYATVQRRLLGEAEAFAGLVGEYRGNEPTSVTEVRKHACAILEEESRGFVDMDETTPWSQVDLSALVRDVVEARFRSGRVSGPATPLAVLAHARALFVALTRIFEAVSTSRDSTEGSLHVHCLVENDRAVVLATGDGRPLDVTAARGHDGESISIPSARWLRPTEVIIRVHGGVLDVPPPGDVAALRVKLPLIPDRLSQR